MMINFKNVYKNASDLKIGDSFRLIGGSVLFVDEITVSGERMAISYHTFDMNRDGSKSTGIANILASGRVREA